VGGQGLFPTKARTLSRKKHEKITANTWARERGSWEGENKRTKGGTPRQEKDHWRLLKEEKTGEK